MASASTNSVRRSPMEKQRLNNYLRCRLTDDDRKRLEEQARRQGLSASAYIRKLLKEKLDHEKAA